MVKPKCKYFNKCGGCLLQNKEYKEQLELKKSVLTEITGFKKIPVFFGKPFNYRNRLDLIFHKGGLGFRARKKWHEIVDIESCEIGEKRINELITEIKKEFKNIDAFDLIEKKGTYKFVVIRTPKNDSLISFVLNSKSKNLEKAINKIISFSKKCSAKNVLIALVEPERDTTISDNIKIIKGSNLLNENLMDHNFIFSGQGFFQNNTEMAEKMHEYCNQLIKKYNTKNTCLLDLYGGVGTFGIINSNLFNKVIIAENVKNAIDCAKINIKNNHVKNADAKVLDAKHIKMLNLKAPLFVITDPPRGGMHPKTIIYLNKIKPKVIIYISCNIKQFEKELNMLRNYKIKSVALFDLFPQTEHSESVIELVLKN